MAKSVGAVTFPARKLTSEMTLKVKISGMAAWKARLWMAKHLLRVAAWVAGMQSKIEIELE